MQWVSETEQEEERKQRSMDTEGDMTGADR